MMALVGSTASEQEAGGHGPGHRLERDPRTAFFVASRDRFHVSRWASGAAEGQLVARCRYPSGLAMDCDGALLVSEERNHRVTRWVPGATEGTVVAGGNGKGSALDQLDCPWGLAVDHDGALLIAEYFNHRVTRWVRGAAQGTVVAGGRDPGSRLDQLNIPVALAVDHSGAVLVAEFLNHRVTRWAPGAKEGTVVAGGRGFGSGVHQLNSPVGLAVDHEGAILVAEFLNHRVTRWVPGATEGTVVAGGGGEGCGLDQLCGPRGVAVDHDGSLLIVELMGNRVMRWVPGAAAGTVVASRHSIQDANPIAIVMESGQRTIWSSEVHRLWPKPCRSFVEVMPLVQLRDPTLGAMGSLLLKSVLPFALPAYCPPHTGTSSWAGVMALPAAAVNDEDDDGLGQGRRRPRRRHRHRRRRDAEAETSASTLPALVLLNFNCSTRPFEESLLRDEVLREVRERLEREASGWHLPRGAKLIASPAQVPIAMRAIAGLQLGVSHMVVSEELTSVVLAAVNALPQRLNVRLVDVQALPHALGGDEVVIHPSGSDARYSVAGEVDHRGPQTMQPWPLHRCVAAFYFSDTHV